MLADRTTVGMNKIELRIMAISRSVTQSQNYAVVLGEQGSNRRLPVIIGAAEAQAIAIAIENMEGPRPMTHDLFRNTLKTLDVDLREVVITDLREGIFFARLIMDRGGDLVEVDSRTSDALALAMRFDCPIYTYNDIMEEAGIVLEGDDDPQSQDIEREESVVKNEDNLARMNVGELNSMLESVLSEENYEKAAMIRDELNRRSAS